MSKPSVASHLRQLHNQPVIMRVTGVNTIEDIDDIRESVKKLMSANDIDLSLLEEDENHFSIKGKTNLFFKPKLPRKQRGTLIVRSKDYIFIPEGKTEADGLFGSKTGFTYDPDRIKVEKVLNTNAKVGGLISFEMDTLADSEEKVSA